ncbi:MAG: LUD domain-containing protein [Verrucomicrobiota bacterium]|nr:LUD domain-containing protein [Verrucomicrobiota bacterium]
MSSRDLILNSVKAALAPLPQRAAHPGYDKLKIVSKNFSPQQDLWVSFQENFSKVHGMSFTTFVELKNFLLSQKSRLGYCDPALTDVFAALNPELTFETAFDRNKESEYSFGITRATGAIAETGSLIFEDATTSSRLGSLAPWIHIACVKRGDLIDTIPTALSRISDDPNIIWVTGPSKTADIEGILVEGAHGPGIQICFLLP